MQGDSSEQYYSPLDEVSISYSNLLEKVCPEWLCVGITMFTIILTPEQTRRYLWQCGGVL